MVIREPLSVLLRTYMLMTTLGLELQAPSLLRLLARCL